MLQPQIRVERPSPARDAPGMPGWRGLACDEQGGQSGLTEPYGGAAGVAALRNPIRSILGNTSAAKYGSSFR